MSKIQLDGILYDSENYLFGNNKKNNTIEWIDVNDKIPEENEYVLIHYVIEEQLNRQAVGYIFNDKWAIYLPYTRFDLNDKLIKVLYWSKLPDLLKHE